MVQVTKSFGRDLTKLEVSVVGQVNDITHTLEELGEESQAGRGDVCVPPPQSSIA